MNKLLKLTGTFEQKSGQAGGAAPDLPANGVVKAEKIGRLIDKLIELELQWKNDNLIDGALIDVEYNCVVAKSNRIKKILHATHYSTENTVVGARFNENNCHIITHFVPLIAINETIERLKIAMNILKVEFAGEVNSDSFKKEKTLLNINYSNYNMAKTTFRQIIVDAYYVANFSIPCNEFDTSEPSVINLYNVNMDTKKLLKEIGIEISNIRIMDETILLDEISLNKLKQEAPYLVSMAVKDLSKLDEIKNVYLDTSFIGNLPSPTNESIVGVIDTMFDKSVYFGEWVTFEDRTSSDIILEPKDYIHGTAVSSIIVDGHNLNPNLDDGCGRFRVKHFGVARANGFNSFTIIREIKKVVQENRDIRVWNISLGSNKEINENFVSSEASLLDQIQYENDVIFVIAGTNNILGKNKKRIGAPADSINSVIVNSVDFNGNIPNYSRHGLVLNFFTKPDLCYYGGGNGEYINVCEPNGSASVSGTSFAAPWITRKLAYMINVLGMNREVAKALLIDSAIGWERESDPERIKYLGNGIVPIDIKKILESEEDEIKFFIEGVSEQYNTYNYSIPVPLYNEKFPYIAKATMCYFPKCSRNQGVDYSNTELDLYFGRLNKDGKILSVDENPQSDNYGSDKTTEEAVRKNFRKWDNVKFIANNSIKKSRAKKNLGHNNWGLSIKTKERFSSNDSDGLKFGIVITLKELSGINRIDDFIHSCSFNNWLVTRIDIDNQVELYQIAEEEIELE